MNEKPKYYKNSKKHVTILIKVNKFATNDSDANNLMLKRKKPELNQ